MVILRVCIELITFVCVLERKQVRTVHAHILMKIRLCLCEFTVQKHASTANWRCKIVHEHVQRAK